MHANRRIDSFQIFYLPRNWSVDPTRSTGRLDSLLNEKKMGVDFRVVENPTERRNGFALESPLNFCFYFIKGKTK